MKICVLIPVLNEAKSIGPLVERILAKNPDVLVINDGSTDGSGEIARKKGARVIDHPQRQGKGSSLRDGFRYALEKNYDGIITMDGDGQHAVEDLDNFIQKAIAEPASVVVGSRMADNTTMPRVRLWTNNFMSWLISCVSGQKIPDTQCGFRYIGAVVLRAVKLASCDYEIESEVLIQASRCGFKIHSVPVKTIYGDEDSKINPCVDTWRFIIFIIKQLFQKRV